jgi:transcriptional regulator GlxA family with amidase domain
MYEQRSTCSGLCRHREGNARVGAANTAYKGIFVHSRLDLVSDWEHRAQASGYSASKMAETLGVTLRFLERFFQARFGVGPHSWIVHMRMTHAAALLATGISVKAVSIELGYKQVSHFSREFKRFFGMPPRNYVFAETSRTSLLPGQQFAFR